MENKIHSSVLVLEQCAVTPASASRDDIHSELTFLDIPWMFFSSIQQLLFYKIPDISRSRFLGHIFPQLKQSLSLALDRFPLVAGKLVIPPNTNSSMPEICFGNGDGVTLICAECDGVDFNHLVMNDARDCNNFYALVHELETLSSEQGLPQGEAGPSIISTDTACEVTTTSPVLALQVTLFPGVGLSIGICNHHALGDNRSMFMFMTSWSIHNFKLSHSKDDDDDDDELLDHLPTFDRNLIQDKKGLAKILCDQGMNFISSTRGSPLPARESSKLRKTFLISAENVKKLKTLVSDHDHNVSSFVVVCSYVWTCLAKSRLTISREEHFVFSADCRERTDPPIPANYFGNCLISCHTSLSGTELAGELGFQRACELVERAIKEKFGEKDSVFDGEEDAMENLSNVDWDVCLTVAGSTRQNFYSLDFGWGTAVKFEFISIDSSGAISLSCCRDSDGGVEVGISLGMPQMDAFSSIFMEGLNC